MKSIIKTMLTLLFTSCFLQAVNSETTEPIVSPQINNAGNGRHIVRVDNNFKYVLLPIEDFAPEYEVSILVDTKLETTFNVRLAMNHIDYYMPLDLSPYKSGNVILDVKSSLEEYNARAKKDTLWLTNITQSNIYNVENTEQYRPSYHHTPLYGWMNDPNGMFYKDGTWHLFFQYGPYGSTWNNMTWGHSVSNDLLHWTPLDNAILPDGLGTIFSGSAVVDKSGSAGFGKDAIVAIYTQADRSQMQSMSYSTDGGKSFSTYKKNPILTLPYEARDPKVFYCESTGKWIMVLASAPAHEVEFYSSDNLTDWTLESRFGKRYGCLDGVWECPDLMELNIRGTDEKRWVLICNINPGGIYGGSATQYFVGTFDGHEFICDTEPEITRWVDYGKDHYAAVSWSNTPDNRHTMIAWMSNWQYCAVVPTTQYRSANTLPRDVELFRGDDGELHLASTPSPEVDNARGMMTDLGSFAVSNKEITKSIPQNLCNAYELDIELNAENAENIDITLSNSNGEKVIMTYNTTDSTFSMDRTASGIIDFSTDFPCITSAPCPDNKKLSLRIFFDHSSLEVFEGEGRFTMTNLVFPTLPYDKISVITDGGKAKVVSAKIYEMK